MYIGFISNTIALGASFAGGNYATQTTATQSNVPLALGSNWLYVYQRDAGCSVSGLILHATITIDPCAVPVDASSWGQIKALC